MVSPYLGPVVAWAVVAFCQSLVEALAYFKFLGEQRRRLEVFNAVEAEVWRSRSEGKYTVPAAHPTVT